MKLSPIELISSFSKFLFIGLLFMSLPILGQDEGGSPVKQRALPVTIRFDGGLGFLMTPKAMKLNFNSVGDANVGTFFHIAKGVNVGLNFRYTGFQVARNASNFNDFDTIGGTIVSVPIHTTHNMFSPGLTIGYDKWISNYSLFNFNINASYSLVRYANIRSLEKDYPVEKIPNRSIYNHNALLIEPAINFMYYFEDHVGMTLKLSYSKLFSSFRPDQVALDQGAISYVSSDLKGQIQFMSFGIGFVYSFKRVD